MGLLGTIIVGFLVGAVARLISPGHDRMGFIFTTVLGILGALVGSYLGQVLGVYQIGEPAGFLGAVIGAVIILAGIKAIARR